MKVELRREEPSRAVLTVEVPPEQVDQAVAAASRKLAQQVRVPGFRPGKAPRAILERHVGRAALYEEALDILLPQAFREAVEVTRIVPINRPAYDVKELNEGQPLRFEAAVDLPPEVTLGDYRALTVEPPRAVNAEEEVARAIEDLRERHSTLAVVPEAAARGDFLRLTVTAPAPGLDRLQEGKDYLIEIGGGTLPAEAEEALVGAVAGQERELPVGNEGARLGVHVDDVRRRQLPDLDDAFARMVSTRTTLAELREELTARAAEEAASAARRDREERAVEALVAASQIALPKSLVEHEAIHVLEEFEERLRSRGSTLETYMRHYEKSAEDVQAEARAAAETRLRRELVLDRFAEAEGIEATEQDVEAEEENLAAGLQQDRERVRQWLGEGNRMNALRAGLRRRLALRRVSEIVAGAQEA